MDRKGFVAFLFIALLGNVCAGAAWAQRGGAIRGKVTAGGSALEGAYVAAHAAGKMFTTYLMTNRNGTVRVEDSR